MTLIENFNQPNTKWGLSYEEQVLAHLEKNGHKVIKRNYKYKITFEGETSDLDCDFYTEYKGKFCFVEAKSSRLESNQPGLTRPLTAGMVFWKAKMTKRFCPEHMYIIVTTNPPCKKSKTHFWSMVAMHDEYIDEILVMPFDLTKIEHKSKPLF